MDLPEPLVLLHGPCNSLHDTVGSARAKSGSVAEPRPTKREDHREMAQQLRIGLVGSGFMGAVHARAARTAGAVVAGTVNRTPEETAAAVTALGAEQGYGSVAEMAPDVD